MQENRIDGLVPGVASVQGLGLCDVLRVELRPCQIAGLIEGLEGRRGVLDEAFEQARTRWDAMAQSELDPENAHALEEDVSMSAYALRTLKLLRAQLPRADHAEPVVLVGPASTVSGLIAAVACASVEDLAELVRGPLDTSEARERLRAAVGAASAWLDTRIECEALEWFTFDPPYDPSERTL